MIQKNDPAYQPGARDDWVTPPSYLHRVEEVFGCGIALDPASSDIVNKYVVDARFYLTKEHDALSIPWHKKAIFEKLLKDKPGLTINQIRHIPWKVFLNPPYGRLGGGRKGPLNMNLWIPKLISEYEQGNIEEAILLVNGHPGSSWFKPLWSYPICFVQGRIRFYDPDKLPELVPGDSPRYENAFVYFGSNPYRFATIFSSIGSVARRWHEDMGAMAFMNDLTIAKWKRAYLGEWKLEDE